MKLRSLVIASVALALSVVVFGAFVRLKDAGLSCPDWPGCYGNWVVPAEADISLAQERYPQRPLEPGKAWIEMSHRYLAGLLGLLILAIAIVAVRHRARLSRRAVILAVVLMPLLLLQAVLGMWTVTQLLRPVIVVAHLSGGMSILLLLWLLRLASGRNPGPNPATALKALRWGALGGLLLLAVQIGLGGWTSANYAALACGSFPGCRPDAWWPADVTFIEVFQSGWRNADVAGAIHMTHRGGALVTALGLGVLSWRAWRHEATRSWAQGLAAALVIQIGVGVSSVFLHWPLALAVLHNALAAVLLLLAGGLWYATLRSPGIAAVPA